MNRDGFDRKIGKKELIILALMSLVLGLPYVQCLGDDTFIYMRLIERFLDSGRFEYNPGEPGYFATSITYFFSWTLLTVILKNIDVARYAISLIFHLLAFVSVYLVASRQIKNRIIMWLLLATVFFDPFYLRWFWGGMETSMKIAAAAFSIYALFRIRPSSTVKSYLLAGLIAGFGGLTRPEMLYFAPLALIYLLFKYPRKLSGLLFFVIGLGLIIVPWMTFAYKTVGWAIPHTVYAKTDNSVTGQYLSQHLIKLLQIAGIPLSVLSGVLLVSGIRRLRPDPGRSGAAAGNVAAWLKDPRKREQIADFLLVALWGGMILGYIVSGVYIASMKTGLFVPFIAVAIGFLINYFTEPEGGFWINRKAMAGLLVLIILISIGVQTKLFYRYSIFNPRYRQGADQEFIEFSKKVKELSGPGDTIGLKELGVIGYYSERRIIDFVGLATPEIVTYKMKYDRDYLSKFFEETGRVPDYVILNYTKGRDERKDTEIQSFYGYSLKPVYSRKIQRISGRRSWDHYDLYVLYKRL